MNNDRGRQTSLMPEREVYPMIINPDLGDYYKLNEKEQKAFRKKEIESLAKQINDLPYADFTEDREKEIARLLPYYTEFTNLFGIDLIAVARTRMQSSATIMKSSPLFMLSMIDDDQKNTESAIFFESRLEAGGFKLNATSQNIVEGFSYRFSVLKRQLKDKYGDYEVDFPAVSLDRMPLLKLQQWHMSNFGNNPLEENKLLKNMQEIFSLRVHDWFHAAVIYDTASTTNIFQKWSDNSFFVKHFFDNPFMINYELLADKTHYLIWREMFKKDGFLKLKIVEMANELLKDINLMEEWIIKENGGDKEEAERIGNYLAYVGLRGLFNVVSFEDSDLIRVVGGNDRFKKVVSDYLTPYKSYLGRVYEGIENIPFRKGKDESLSMEQIFGEYVDALTEEARILRAKSITTAILRIDLSGFGYKEILDELPKEILAKMENLDLDLSDYDPRVFQVLSANLDFIKNKYGRDIYTECIRRIEVDDSGYFYLKVNSDEISETEGWKEVLHSKKAILIQLPWDYKTEFDLNIKRTQNLLAEQVGSSVKIKPGEVILINIQDEKMAKEMIERSVVNGNFDFDKFWKTLEKERQRGHSSLSDAYPYDIEKVQKVFDTPDNMKKMINNNLVITPSVYSTFESNRKAVLALGPVSLNGRSENERRRILYGAIVDNHTSSKTEIDIFPVDAKSFDRYYKGKQRLELSPFRLKNSEINMVIDGLLKSLEQANSIKIYGFRGKPEKVKIGSSKT